MKKLIISGSIATLLLPMIALAAFNDVTLGSNARVTAAGQTINVSGDSNVIETIGVESEFFTFTLKANSFLELSSPSFKQIEWSATSTKYVTASTCEANSSTVRFASSANEAAITVFPKSASCPQGTTNASGSSSSGGGGGGGGADAATTNVATPIVAINNAEAIAAIKAQLIVLIQELIKQLIAELQAQIAAQAQSSY